MQQPHLFSHQNPYHHQASADWQHHAAQQQSQSHHSYAQSQAAVAAHQQHYGRMGLGTGQSGNGSSAGVMNASSGMGNSGGGGGGGGGRENGLDHSVGHNNMFGGPGEQSSDDNRRVLEWIAQVLNANTRESALLELSKKREQVPELALILWHSFGMCNFHVERSALQYTDRRQGVMTCLLQEIISVYPLLNPSQLTAAASNRVCNALALLQCVASHSETRGLFLGGMFCN